MRDAGGGRMNPSMRPEVLPAYCSPYAMITAGHDEELKPGIQSAA